ncbi:TRAP transporter small permease subunit [Azoarcus sp. KH32C]|uniref:TRAP transporter small permease subunit n=1 Tax=Azoarcus sp. KH32C TaxID=748247 RepID=UPI0002386D50|nr:TRAP transporter small permease subunit [Azoarcus sp. KH32C]BAL23347.1 C4-dicarboxylate transport system permease, small subunit [Azoarcus sp. KH32C]
MSSLIKLSNLIDALNERIGRSAIWLVLIAVLISAINAVVRKAFNVSSNAFLEIQWYLFSGVFLLGAAYTLRHNEHVRIDVLSGRFSKRTQHKIEIFGTLFFLLPLCGMMVWLSVPWFMRSFASGEVSANAGGLTLWPAKLLVPVGFILLGLQGLSELIKRIAVLQGLIPDPTERHDLPTAEENLIEELRKAQEAKNNA